MPQVNILVATYNSERYLEPLISSLLSQTHKDIAVIVRDDGSSDNTLDVVRRFAELDGRISILDLPSAVHSARTNFFTLLLGEGGDYTMFCDADDVWLPDKVEKTLAKMQQAEQKYGEETPILVHTDLSVVDKDLNMIAASLFSYEKLSPERKTLKNLLVQNNITGCATMVNRPLREMVKTMPDDAVMHDWWLGLIASAFGKIEVLYEPTILYRQHGENEVGAYDASDPSKAFQKLKKKDRMRDIYRAMYRQAGFFAAVYKDSLTEAQYHVATRYAEMERLNKLQKIGRIIRYGYYKNTFLRNIGQLLVV